MTLLQITSSVYSVYRSCARQPPLSATFYWTTRREQSACNPPQWQLGAGIGFFGQWQLPRGLSRSGKALIDHVRRNDWLTRPLQDSKMLSKTYILAAVLERTGAKPLLERPCHFPEKTILDACSSVTVHVFAQRRAFISQKSPLCHWAPFSTDVILELKAMVLARTSCSCESCSEMMGSCLSWVSILTGQLMLQSAGCWFEHINCSVQPNLELFKDVDGVPPTPGARTCADCGGTRHHVRLMAGSSQLKQQPQLLHPVLPDKLKASET